MRYAVINDQTKEVTNVIMWDGESSWSPPSGFSIKATEDAGIGDIWHETRNEFMRPMSRQKPPETQEIIQARQKQFEESKAIFKSGILFLSPNGNLES